MKRELIVATEPIQDYKDKSLWFCDVINGGTRVARVSSPNDLEALRLARLFAAAPELLAALKSLIKAMDVPSDLTPINLEGQIMMVNHAKDKARIAIAKAENSQN